MMRPEHSLESMAPEQQQAVRALGGLILEAGAGSGKTAVIIAHLFEKIADFLPQLSSLSAPQTEDVNKLNKFLSQIVVMTFTNMAVEEIRLRIEARCVQLIAIDPHWKIVQASLDKITVSTIHSFCAQLLRRGIFTGVNPDFEIVDEAQVAQKLQVLATSWMLARPDLEDDFFLHRHEVIEALVEIFSENNSRLSWEQSARQLALQGETGADLWQAWKQLQQIPPFANFWYHDFDFARDLKLTTARPSVQKWIDFVMAFEGLKGAAQAEAQEGSVEAFARMFQRFLDYSAAVARRPQLPKEDEFARFADYWESLKAFRDQVLKEDGPHWLAALEERTHYWRVYQRIYDLFTFIEQNYFQNDHYSYADLEYLVYQGLQKASTQLAAAQIYNYFIIDEFQDVSEVQFAIARALVQDDYQRLFCVGDIKQSIYAFRGGDIQVFLANRNRFPSRQALLNNYRSHPSIVQLNNLFFTHLFAERMEFYHRQGSREPFAICQHAARNDGAGGVRWLHSMLAPDQSAGTVNLDLWEARTIADYCERLQKAEAVQEVVVLYAELRPSTYLVQELMRRQIPFRAQTKLPLSEDPIILLFTHWLSFLLDQAADPIVRLQRVTTLWQIQLDLLSDDERPTCDLRHALQVSQINLDLMGVHLSFTDLLFKCGVRTLPVDRNLELLKQICHRAQDDLEVIWQMLRDLSGERSTFFIQGGAAGLNEINPDFRVTLMTIHGSKGLEFEHVILAGIYTNGRRRGLRTHVGSGAGSFRWFSPTQGKKFSSPGYLVEKYLETAESEAEKKRLFYVAMTRAKNFLAIADLDLSQVDSKLATNSWANLLRYFLIQSESASALIDHSWTFPYTVAQLGANSPVHSRPFLLTPTVEQHTRVLTSIARPATMLLSDLSITKFITLVECPYRFYLTTLCRFEQEDVEIVASVMESTPTHGPSLPAMSDAKRGIHLHHKIAEFIANPQTRYNCRSEDLAVLGELFLRIDGVRADYQLVSEKNMRFVFERLVLTGTPDLLLIPSRPTQSGGEIWDFKSGRRDPDKERSYLLQLYAYAYGAYQLKLLKEFPIKVTLVYLDEKMVHEESVQLAFLEHQLQTALMAAQRPDQVNPAFCAHCHYQIFCDRKNCVTIETTNHGEAV